MDNNKMRRTTKKHDITNNSNEDNNNRRTNVKNKEKIGEQKRNERTYIKRK